MSVNDLVAQDKAFRKKLDEGRARNAVLFKEYFKIVGELGEISNDIEDPNHPSGFPVKNKLIYHKDGILRIARKLAEIAKKIE